MTEYERAQRYLDAAYRAANNLVRETRPEMVDVWVGHAERWLLRVEEAVGDDFADSVLDVRSMIAYHS